MSGFQVKGSIKVLREAEISVVLLQVVFLKFYAEQKILCFVLMYPFAFVVLKNYGSCFARIFKKDDMFV